MKIFNKTGNWENKVNFVDENNVVLGYDMEQCCCEDAGWFISDNEETTTVSSLPNSDNGAPTLLIDEDNVATVDLSNYIFCPDYFVDIQDTLEKNER